MIDSQSRGAKASGVGETLEAELDRYHERLRRASLADVWQSYPPLKYLGAQIGFRPAGKGAFDRWGSLFTGRSIYFELKHRIAKDFFTWKDTDEHQLKALRRMVHITQGMALCFIIVDWEYKATKELRLHWITDIPESRIERETGIWLKNRRWYDTLDNGGLIDLPDSNIQYMSAKSDPAYQRLAVMWANGQLF